MENIYKPTTENKGNSKLKVWEAPQLILLDENETEAGALYHPTERHATLTTPQHS